MLWKKTCFHRVPRSWPNWRSVLGCWHRYFEWRLLPRDMTFPPFFELSTLQSWKVGWVGYILGIPLGEMQSLQSLGIQSANLAQLKELFILSQPYQEEFREVHFASSPCLGLKTGAENRKVTFFPRVFSARGIYQDLHCYKHCLSQKMPYPHKWIMLLKQAIGVLRRLGPVEPWLYWLYFWISGSDSSRKPSMESSRQVMYVSHCFFLYRDVWYYIQYIQYVYTSIHNVCVDWFRLQTSMPTCLNWGGGRFHETATE